MIDTAVMKFRAERQRKLFAMQIFPRRRPVFVR